MVLINYYRKVLYLSHAVSERVPGKGNCPELLDSHREGVLTYLLSTQVETFSFKMQKYNYCPRTSQTFLACVTTHFPSFLLLAHPYPLRLRSFKPCISWTCSVQSLVQSKILETLLVWI